jgi:hypothetical protein
MQLPMYFVNNANHLAFRLDYGNLCRPDMAGAIDGATG